MIEFTIEREKFLKGVQKTLGIVERKATLPIMANVLIEAVLPCGGGGFIRLEATDMELRLSVEYPASVIKEGRITVPAKKIYEAVRELAGETLHLVESAAATVIMTSNKAVCKLRGLAADEFPAFPEADAAAGDSVFFGIKSALLRKLIGLVYASISTDEMRKTLTGVFLERDPDLVRTLVRMTSADGHRLSTATADMTEEEARIPGGIQIPDKGVIIPRKGLQEIRKLIEGEEGDVQVGIAKGNCIVRNEKGARLSVSLIDGQFPDWRHVMPEPADGDAVIRCDRAALLHGVRRMGVIEPGRVDMTASASLLVLNSTHPDIGDIRDELPAEYEGAERKAAFNGGFLIDVLEAVSGDTVELRLPAGRDLMAVIRDPESDDYKGIVMGLKI